MLLQQTVHLINPNRREALSHLFRPVLMANVFTTLNPGSRLLGRQWGYACDIFARWSKIPWLCVASVARTMPMMEPYDWTLARFSVWIINFDFQPPMLWDRYPADPLAFQFNRPPGPFRSQCTCGVGVIANLSKVTGLPCFGLCTLVSDLEAICAELWV